MSSTPPPSTLPSSAELENLGVLFVGFVSATVLYGLTFFQTYIYYSRYPKDIQWIKYLVRGLSPLSCTRALILRQPLLTRAQRLYYYLIVMFDVNMDILYATTETDPSTPDQVLLTFICQLYETHCSSHLRVLTPLVLSFFAHRIFTGMFEQRQLSAFATSNMEVVAAISQSFAAIADVIIFATMCYSLRKARFPDMLMPEGFVETTVTLLVSRGLGFTLIQVAYFCVFVASPAKQFWIPFQMVGSKFYVNTVLGLLNAREVKHGQGLNEENSLTDRKSSTDAGLPSAIRFNVVDTKAVSRVSIDFLYCD
ncbi:hypothetical protein HYDPIDRAFT_138279 [Hydnomerulius pinastri MD-312]|uniref:DUF6534 domain-containing protein n=1 Tax=Hydnomerulius pinastri MD-312 TaxID=994086 RepID=A0A0C9V685_9AGAM|nr:hypothetical protein HYDPIDRAFT_138279 [Hydnomerulius pinastri MD-312]